MYKAHNVVLPVHVFNGPSKLSDLENVNLNGATLVFNGQFDLRDLRQVNLHAANVYVNGRDVSTLLEPPRSPRADQYPRPSIDIYRLREPRHSTRASTSVCAQNELKSRETPLAPPFKPSSITSNLDIEPGFRDSVIALHSATDLHSSNDLQNDPLRLSPVPHSAVWAQQRHQDSKTEGGAIAQNVALPAHDNDQASIRPKRARASSQPLGRNEQRIRTDVGEHRARSAKLQYVRPGTNEISIPAAVCADKIGLAKLQYARAERELRRQRKELGRASESAVRRVHLEGRKLAELYEHLIREKKVDSVLSQEKSKTTARELSEDGEIA